MHFSRSILVLLFCTVTRFASAEDTPIDIQVVMIQPSRTEKSLAKVELTVGPLEYKEPGLCGTYEIKVKPFSFKNDHGQLQLSMPEEIIVKMKAGEPVEFTGKAMSDRDNKIKLIKGKTNPEAKELGAVTFVVTTEDGDLTFNTSYKVKAK